VASCCDHGHERWGAVPARTIISFPSPCGLSSVELGGFLRKSIEPCFLVLFLLSAAAPSGPGPPYWVQQLPVGQGLLIHEVFWITLNDPPQSDSSGQVTSSSQWPLPNNTQHSQETNIHAPVGFEPTIAAGGRPQTYALDRAPTGTGILILILPIDSKFPYYANHLHGTKSLEKVLRTGISRIWRNPSVYYRVHRISPLELVRIVVSIISTTPNVVLSNLCYNFATSNVLIFWHCLCRLMHWCLWFFVFESPWAWRLGAETCSSSTTYVQFLNLLCAFVGIYDWLIDWLLTVSLS